MSVKRMAGWVMVLGLVAGVTYLATVGCCHLMDWRKKPLSLTAQLELTPEQKAEVVQLERTFMQQRQTSCQNLCAKRAQLIQILEKENPDRDLIARLVDEIGTEQTFLERTTVDHLLAVREHLTPLQRKKFASKVAEQLRTACQATACGSTPGCSMSSEAQER